MHLQSANLPLATRERVLEGVIHTLRGINMDDEREVKEIDPISEHVDDSLDVADLASRLEQTYGILLTNKELQCRIRVMDLVDTIYLKVQEARAQT